MEHSVESIVYCMKFFQDKTLVVGMVMREHATRQDSVYLVHVQGEASSLEIGLG